MIYILQSADRSAPQDIRVVLVRHTPTDPTYYDLFCVSDDVPLGQEVRPLHDGWHADDHGGGIAVWGGGRYWELRPTPFEVSLSDTDS
jgi:hypothetical protein